jgi:two-component system, cell cycle sensor histidine kinase and response regulator CckA
MRETILLVEDEHSLRTVVKMCLELTGYTVLEADNGVVALEMVDEHPGPIHLLLTDVDMNPISGPELAEQLLVIRPDIQVLFTSGRRDDGQMPEELALLNARFLPKPFNPKALETAVEQALAQAA